MKEKLLLFHVVILFVLISVKAQDEKWEPQKQITGYIALEGDYFSGIQYYDREYGVAVSEAGILANYKPIEKLVIKSVFTYRPEYSIDQMLNESYAEYKFKDYFKVKGGRFLTPLSPMNTYYYAPVNNSATLPMLIQNYEFFPLKMNGLSLNGFIGEGFKISYEVFAGGFKNALWLKTGAMGFFGTEYDYFQRVINKDTTEYSGSDANVDLQFGRGGHVGFSYQDYVNIGVNIFSSDESITQINEAPDAGQAVTTILHFDKLSFGLNVKFKYSTLQLLGEYWKTTVSFDFLGPKSEMDYKGAFLELSNSFGKLTPYLRYEYHERPIFGADPIDYYRYTAGINYKPIFEVGLKLEYMHYEFMSENMDGLVASVIYSF